MNDMVKRLREQSKFHNSTTVMKLFAEAADYVEQLEHKLASLHTPSRCYVYKPDKPAEYIKITFEITNPKENVHTQYDKAMKLLHE